MDKLYYEQFGQKSLDSFASRLIRLTRVQDEMQRILRTEAQPIIDKVSAGQALSQDDINNCHDLLVDLVDNESEPETGFEGFGTGLFSINVMNFGGVVYWVEALEFDPIGYFGSRKEAEEIAESEYEPFITAALRRRKPKKKGKRGV